MILRLHKYQKLSLLGTLSLITVLLIIFINNVQRQSTLNASKLSTTTTTDTNTVATRQPMLVGSDGTSKVSHTGEEAAAKAEVIGDADPIIVEQSEGVVVYEKSPYARPRTPPANYEHEKATFFSLVRNSDMYGILHSIRQVEDRFNKNYHYDWVFANDKPFTQSFKKMVNNLCSGKVTFVELTKDYWTYPEWIDQNRAKEVRLEMSQKQIKYGNSESYRQMCRFNSGLFYKMPALAPYKYYWRVEPDIEYHCDIDYDPFKYMKKHNKIYGFNLAPLELHTTVTSLWDTVKNYTKEYPANVAPGNNMLFLTDDDGETFNMCHFWSNFEIGDLDFFRSEKYNHFFDYLDHAGGIYYERWGDAPIHTMAVSLLVPNDQLFFVPNTGYFHNPNGDCPRSLEVRLEKNCNCNPRYDFTWALKSCIPKFFDIHHYNRPDGAPKRAYKPIHNWDKVLHEEERNERARQNAESRQKQKEEEAAAKEALEKGVEGANQEQAAAVDPPPIENTAEGEEIEKEISVSNGQNNAVENDVIVDPDSGFVVM